MSSFWKKKIKPREKQDVSNHYFRVCSIIGDKEFNIRKLKQELGLMYKEAEGCLKEMTILKEKEKEAAKTSEIKVQEKPKLEVVEAKS